MAQNLETDKLAAEFGVLIGNLEDVSKRVYQGKPLGLKPGLNIRTLPEYINAVTILAQLRETALSKYAEHTR